MARAARTIHAVTDISGLAALTTTDDGRSRLPESDQDWLAWVAASRTRNWLLEDPLLDWLRQHGEAKGFVADDQRDGYNDELSFREFIFAQGKAFEDGVVAILRDAAQVVEVGEGPADSRDLAAAERTIAAMHDRVEIVAQGVLRDAERQTYGMADLLIRSDVLAMLFPESIEAAEVGIAAPGLGLSDRHYRVIDIKFRTLGLLKDGALDGGTDTLPYQSQVWVYNMALGRIQGFTPPLGYILGRNWTQTKERGGGCLERLGPVSMHRLFKGRENASLEELTLRALDWIRQVRLDGADWTLSPAPTRPELYPHMRHDRDDPWHAAKAKIGNALGELTLLPRMNPALRRAAHDRGITRWDDAAASANALGISGEASTGQLDGVLAANRSSTPVVLPDRIVVPDMTWRTKGQVELYVDFETVNSLDDDFGDLPAPGGQPLIFQVGCGWMRDGDWHFDQWTADRLDEPSEVRMIDAFVKRIRGFVADADRPLDEARIFHWSPAEVSTLESAYNSATQRHPDKGWPEMPWYDLLQQVVRPAPLTVTGAFAFGLKPIAKSLHAMGLIQTAWGDSVADGMGAMVAAWRVDDRISQVGGKLIDDPLMRAVAEYNEVDCRVMAEILSWLRAREDANHATSSG